MNVKHIIIRSLIAFSIVALVQACGSSSNSDKDKNSEEFKEAEGKLEEQIEDVVYNIPSPSEIPYILKQTGAEFNQSLVNPRSNADKYVSRNDKAALNLGVYSADIGYLSSYDKTQEAIDYLAVCKKLADNLNIIGSFDADILQKFEENIDDKDSLALVLNAAVQQTDKYLKNDDRDKLAALVITGSFVEGLYISTGLVNSYPKDLLPEDKRNLVLTPIIRVILEQKKSVEDLVSMLGAVEQTEPVITIRGELEQLVNTYQALNIEDQIKNNRADLLLSDENLMQVTTIVGRLRKSITE